MDISMVENPFDEDASFTNARGVEAISSANYLDDDDESLEGLDEDQGLLSDEARSTARISTSEEDYGGLTACLPSCCTLDFLRPYFDVDTRTIEGRILKVLNPRRFSTRFYDELKTIDLYGPFWITTTLIVAVTIASNYVQYCNFVANQEVFVPGGDLNYGDPLTAPATWQANFDIMYSATVVFYGIFASVPLSLFFLLNSIGTQRRSMLELVSLYGYSNILFFIPCVLALLDWRFIVNLSVSYCWAVSSLFLLYNIIDGFPASQYTLSTASRVTSYVIVVLIVFVQGVVSMCFSYSFLKHD